LGFTQKTILTWAKDKMGVGDWLRGKTEHCLLAVRGKPIVELKNQTTLMEGAVRKHSQKPTEFYDVVEALCPARRAMPICFRAIATMKNGTAMETKHRRSHDRALAPSEPSAA
jgi:N6-adenosine-specific RNA methylase IME4